MVNILNAFPSNYIKASDLQGREIPVVVSHVQFEKVDGDDKPVIYFKGKEKGIVLNKTNANNIAVLYGSETDRWIGETVVIYPTTTDFQGKTVDCIRIKGPMKEQKQAPPPQPQGGGIIDDDIPFAPYK